MPQTPVDHPVSAELRRVAAACAVRVSIATHGAPAAEVARARQLTCTLYGFLDPTVQARLNALNVVLDIIPETVKLTDLPGYKRLRGRTVRHSGGHKEESRSYDSVRGLAWPRKGSSRTVRYAVGAETLRDTGFQNRGGVLVHETAHMVHMHGLSAAQRRLIKERLAIRKAAGGPWLPRETYSSINEFEWFAGLFSAYADYGTYRGWANYTRAWIAREEPEVAALLTEILPGVAAQPTTNGMPWFRSARRAMPATSACIPPANLGLAS